MRNVREMVRMQRTVEAFLKAGVTAAVRFTRRALVRATPKRTQFAAGWVFGVGGPPDLVPQDKPTQTLFPLPGDQETDAQMEAEYGLGDDVAMVSPATYIVFLNAGTSPQAPENFVQDAIDEAATALEGWRWEGLAA